MYDVYTAQRMFHRRVLDRVIHRPTTGSDAFSVDSLSFLPSLLPSLPFFSPFSSPFSSSRPPRALLTCVCLCVSVSVQIP